MPRALLCAAVAAAATTLLSGPARADDCPAKTDVTLVERIEGGSKVSYSWDVRLSSAAECLRVHYVLAIRERHEDGTVAIERIPREFQMYRDFTDRVTFKTKRREVIERAEIEDLRCAPCP